MNKQVALSMVSILALGGVNAQAGWPEQVDVAGSAIFEMSMISGDYQGDSLDMRLFEFYLGIDAKLNDKVSATVGLLYEEGDDESTDFGVDEGYLTLQMSDSALIQFGLMAIPFGSFNTSMINDPFSLVLGETIETGALINWANDMLGVSAYAFNGNVYEAGDDDTVNSFGFRVVAGSEDMNLTLDYINNIGDADTYSGGPYPEVNTTADLAGGVSVAGHAAMGSVTVDFEYIAALDPVAVGGTGEVESFGLEVGMTLDGNCECAVGAAVQASDNAAGTLPEIRISLGYTRPVMDVLTLNTRV